MGHHRTCSASTVEQGEAAGLHKKEIRGYLSTLGRVLKFESHSRVRFHGYAELSLTAKIAWAISLAVLRNLPRHH